MGGGEFIPNGSMHWRVYEEDVKKNGKSWIRKAKGLSQGIDPIAREDVGQGKYNDANYSGKILVTLRFKDAKEAAQVLPGIRGTQVGDDEYEIKIPMTPLDKTDGIIANNPLGDLAQVKVEW